MPIKILEIRSYIQDGVRKKYRKPIGVEAESVEQIFARTDYYLSQIAKEDHFNLHYSIAHWDDETGKEFSYQEVFPIDLDGIDITKLDEYIDIVCSILELSKEDIGIVASGHGLHFLIGMIEPITDPAYFAATRHYYKALCGRIATACFHAGLPCEADSMSWQVGKSLRLPNTTNKKDGKPDTQCVLLNPTIKKFDLDIVQLSKLPDVAPDEQISTKMVQTMSIDTAGVLTCPFLQYCKASPAEITEPQWYASLSLIGRLEGGYQIAHEMSEGHPQYNKDETDIKIEQALECTGPRTCANIGTLWTGCMVCDKSKTITSPIQITTKEFIKTKDTGFYNMVKKNEVYVKGKPNYNDLCKFFEQSHPYCTIDGSRTVMTYASGLWDKYSKNMVHNFAEINFDPCPSNSMCIEFETKLQRSSIQPATFFETIGKVNFENGWQDMESMDGILNPHTKDMGFLYKLPFKYRAEAKAPRFEKFMDEVMLGNEELKTILYEYMGYVFSGADPDIGSKALIMVGDGSNGKSVLVDVIRQVVGKGNYSVTNLRDAISKPEARANMTGKLLNISEETPSNALMDSSTFKNLVTGGEVESRRLYDNSISMKNIAKLIMTCNALPMSGDLTYGMRRRLLIVPFEAMFTDTLGNRDPFIRDKLYKELPGIFNLCYKYYSKMKDRGHFTKSEATREKLQDFLDTDNPVAEWVYISKNFELTRDNSDHAKTLDVYADYQRFCVLRQIEPEKPTIFGRQLLALGAKKVRRQEDGSREYFYNGIKPATRGADEAGTSDTQETDF